METLDNSVFQDGLLCHAEQVSQAVDGKSASDFPEVEQNLAEQPQASKTLPLCSSEGEKASVILEQLQTEIPDVCKQVIVEQTDIGHGEEAYALSPRKPETYDDIQEVQDVIMEDDGHSLLEMECESEPTQPYVFVDVTESPPPGNYIEDGTGGHPCGQVALSTENGSEDPLPAISAQNEVQEGEKERNVAFLQSETRARALHKERPIVVDVDEDGSEKLGRSPAEGGADLQSGEDQPEAAAQDFCHYPKELSAASSPSDNATVIEDTIETRRVQRLRRLESKPSVERSSESGSPVTKKLDCKNQLTDEDEDAMVDDPKDEDFVPHSTPSLRRSARQPSRNQRGHGGLHMGTRQPGSHFLGFSRRAFSSSLAQPRAAKPRLPGLFAYHGASQKQTKMYCATCMKPLQKGQTAYQRKGMPQLFCSSACLSAFGHRPPRKKPCAFCKKDIGGIKDTVFAQTGSSNSFEEFCSNACLSLYEAQYEKSSLDSVEVVGLKCSMCHKVGEIQHEVSSGNMVHHLCSDTCFTHFRATKGLKTSCCDSCGLYIYTKTSRSEYLLHEGQQRRFCNTTCLAQFKKKNCKVLSCQWCKTMCKNFDMLSHADPGGKTLLFCSVCCLTSYKVRLTRDADSVLPCRVCRQPLPDPPYYFKTNSTVYQLCSPSCWYKFQDDGPDCDIHLTCNSCHQLFNQKPEILDWKEVVYQFCSKECCAKFKRLRRVEVACEHCKQDKVLHIRVKFSGVERNFCSADCLSLYKQDFNKILGSDCIQCAFCSQFCSCNVTEVLDGHSWDFCSADCKNMFILSYLKSAICHGCKRKGKLLETICWRGDMKQYCDKKCLLSFFLQHNQPTLESQEALESRLMSQPPESKSPPVVLEKTDYTEKRQPKTQSSKSPPPPNDVSTKNKASICKPTVRNRGTNVKPETRSQGCQTDDSPPLPPLVLPIPVPVFIPLPLHMYCRYVPVPFNMPLPIPIPMFVPTTLENAEKIMEAIEEFKVKIPSNPIEADILAMAEMIAEASEMDKDAGLSDLVSNQEEGGLLEDCDLFGPSKDDMLSMAVKMASALDEPGQELEAQLPKTPLDLNPNVEFLFDCGIVTPDSARLETELPVAAQKATKRVALSESCSRETVAFKPSGPQLDCSYGINAWKAWTNKKLQVLEERKRKRFKVKEDILSCTAAELNFGLAQFVKEISSPSEGQYSPDVVYYLCLGIQQYLLENHRMVNIFTDPCYTAFVQELNKILCKWQPDPSVDGVIQSSVEEEHLWGCKQLGVYSPFVLLNTLMYFNTKYFGLRTVEEHLQLSFVKVMRQSRASSSARGPAKMHSVCYYPNLQHKKHTKESSTGKRKREDEQPYKEQVENKMNPLRCPVKFFEFYLSKCSGSVRNRSDLFYLQPERSCVAESPLWYSSVPVERAALENMLHRILAVKEIYSSDTNSAELY